MRGLSLWQPWASFIAKGWKQIETRSWTTNYRGPIAIHAAMTKRGLRSLSPEVARLAYMAFPNDELSLVFGAIVAVGTLADVVHTEPPPGIRKDPRLISITFRESQLGNYEPGRFAWLLEDVHEVFPGIPLRGHQGLFSVDEALEEKIIERTRA